MAIFGCDVSNAPLPDVPVKVSRYWLARRHDTPPRVCRRRVITSWLGSRLSLPLMRTCWDYSGAILGLCRRMSAYITGNIAVDRGWIEGEGRTSERCELDSAQSHGVLPRAVARSAAMCTGIQRDVSSPAVCRCIVVLPAVCSLVHVQ